MSSCSAFWGHTACGRCRSLRHECPRSRVVLRGGICSSLRAPFRSAGGGRVGGFCSLPSKQVNYE